MSRPPAALGTSRARPARRIAGYGAALENE
jgi:hypothetical protein